MLAAVILVAFVALAVRFHMSESRLAGVTEPERALALLVGRTMDVETGLTAAPAWERRLYSLTLSDAGRELDQAIAWYEELADYSLAPSVDLRLAILRGEGGRRGPLARALEEWQARGEPLATYASVISAAYLDEEEVDADAVGDAVAALGPGWFADVLALRLAARFDEPALGATARRSLAERAGPLLWRLRALSLGDVALLLAGALALDSKTLQICRDGCNRPSQCRRRFLAPSYRLRSVPFRQPVARRRSRPRAQSRLFRCSTCNSVHPLPHRSGCRSPGPRAPQRLRRSRDEFALR